MIYVVIGDDLEYAILTARIFNYTGALLVHRMKRRMNADKVMASVIAICCRITRSNSIY